MYTPAPRRWLGLLLDKGAGPKHGSALYENSIHGNERIGRPWLGMGIDAKILEVPEGRYQE